MTEIASSVAAQSVRPGDQFDISQQLARDLLEGCYHDYLFFCLEPSVQVNTTTYYSQYILIVGDVETSETGFDCSACTVYDIRVQDSHAVRFDEYEFTGSDAAGDISGSIKSKPIQVHSYSELFYSYEKNAVSVSVPSGCVLYGSGQNLPHLVEGGERYAFAALCAVAVSGVLVGMYRIFRYIL